MTTTCPHCATPIEIAADTLAALQGQPNFVCPSCHNPVPVPRPPGPRPVAPLRVGAAPVRQSGTRPASAATLGKARRGLNRNLLVLGSAALLVLGGLVAFLASRKGVTPNNITRISKSEIVNNKFVQQLIERGEVTAKDMEEIFAVEPHGDSHIGISGIPLTWDDARALAARVKAVVLPLDGLAGRSTEETAKDMSELFPSLQGVIVWVSQSGEPRFADLPDFGKATALSRRRKALLYWAPPTGATASSGGAKRMPADPAEFVRIPPGEFVMGDRLDGLADARERPVRTGGFVVGSKEVTYGLWRGVAEWAREHGYTDLAQGGGKAPDHPVHSVSWYDAVKWCNARSEMETLAPCYRESGVVYRAGSAGSLTCDWSASGFRLPSEAEWERAARGGSGGKRFPWGDTIDHSRANCYLGYPGFPYAGASNGSYHPEYRTGRDPYTAPVGMFPANGYGLYDTSGNIMEWCWNWYVPDDSSSPTDPHGPENGKLRVCRGGGWHSNADDCRNAVRSRSDPGGFSNHLGFRIARAATP